MSIYHLNHYVASDEKSRLQFAKEVQDRVQIGMTFSGFTDSAFQLPLFVLAPFEINLIAVPGARYTRGISEKKAARLEAHGFDTKEIEGLDRGHTVEIEPFLMSVRPIKAPLIDDVVPDVYDRLLDDEPALVFRRQLSDVMGKFGASVPSQGALEFALRGGVETNFVFGDDLPADNELEKWMSMCGDDCSKSNGFGFEILFSGEWAVDNDTDRLLLQGGAGQLWPWQCENEWKFALPEFFVGCAEERYSGVRLFYEIS